MKVTVNPKWLRKHLASKRLVILDARSRGSYEKSHIRGAIHADLFHYFIPGTDRIGLARFQKELSRKLGKMGLTGKETVVVYESKFGMRAARVAWMLEYAGARTPFLLEGGFQAWRGLRYPVESKHVETIPQVFQIQPVPRVIATADEVRADRSGIILDVRSKGEFLGTEGRECDDRRGRIPRSKWFEWTNFIDHSGRFKTKSELSSAMRENGLERNQRVTTYCHRGARAAAAYYALRSLGLANVKNYAGSWHEWSARKSLPIDR